MKVASVKVHEVPRLLRSTTKSVKLVQVNFRNTKNEAYCQKVM